MPTRIEMSSLVRARRILSGHFRRAVTLALVMTPVSPDSIERSSPPRCHKARGVFQRCTLGPERRERGFRIPDKRLEVRRRWLDPAERQKRCLGAAGTLGHRLADRLFIAFGIEQIVGKLEGLAEG